MSGGVVQISNVMRFAGVSRIVVPLEQPTRPGSVIAVAFELTGAAVTVTRVDDSAVGARWWRVGNDTLMSYGRRVCWLRLAGAPPGVVEIVGDVANGKAVDGSALALEAQTRSPGDALQLLADLLGTA